MSGMPVLAVTVWDEVAVRWRNVCWFNMRTAECGFFAQLPGALQVRVR